MRRNGRCIAGLRCSCLLTLAAFFLISPQLAHAQQLDSALVPENPLANTAAESIMVAPTQPPEKPPVDREIAVMGMIQGRDYRLFSATVQCAASGVMVEYDRHSWGYFLHARFDYAAELLPIILLSQPVKSDIWGNALTPNNQLVPGVGIDPIGFRLLWRGNKAIKPYLIGLGGGALFTRKALSPHTSYLNFNIQGDFGLQIRMSDRVELRVEPVELFHISDGYLEPSNPGMDELSMKFGLTYHLAPGKQW